jgi:hypothetical protein
MPIRLSNRAMTAVRGALKKSAVTPAAVATLDYHVVLVQPGCGIKTMNEIEEWLVCHGMTFRVMRRFLGAILLDMETGGRLPDPQVIDALRARLNTELGDGIYASTQFLDAHPARLNAISAKRPLPRRQPQERQRSGRRRRNAGSTAAPRPD